VATVFVALAGAATVHTHPDAEAKSHPLFVNGHVLPPATTGGLCTEFVHTNSWLTITGVPVASSS
jgi:hypothetical protein